MCEHCMIFVIEEQPEKLSYITQNQQIKVHNYIVLIIISSDKYITHFHVASLPECVCLCVCMCLLWMYGNNYA